MIKEHESWLIFSPTKIDEYMQCPRRYFYRYILGWTSERERNDKAFGTAWHKSMDFIRNSDYSPVNVAKAYDIFLKNYRQEFGPETDTLYEPKTPANAGISLAKYVSNYSDDHNTYKFLYTEILITVLLGRQRTLYCNLDSIVQRKSDSKYGSLDSKTTKQFSRQWRDEWMLSNQFSAYHHALYSLYGFDSIFGIYADGVAFYKTKTEFERVFVYRTIEDMSVWLWNINYWIDMIETEMDYLADSTDDDPVMKCFPMNTTACTDFWGCPYFDYCTAWTNPLQHADHPPIGLKVSYWDPREQEAKHNFTVGGD